VMKMPAGLTTLINLHTANLDDPVALRGVQTGCLGIQNYLTHSLDSWLILGELCEW
jgi:hypothetical protein